MPIAEEDIYDAATRWWQDLRLGRAAPEQLQAWLDADPRHGEALSALQAAESLLKENRDAPELIKLRGDALKRAHQAGARRWGATPVPRRAALAAGLAGLLAVPAAGWWFRQRHSAPIVTGTGEQRVLTLSDNSRVTLDARSSLRIKYSNDLRGIELLSGRAHFEVAKDPSRPFRVTAGDKTVTALGTAFTVERREQAVTVFLAHGRIAVGSSDTKTALKHTPELLPNTQLIMADHEAPVVQHDLNPSDALIWREGKLFFDNEPLSQVADRLNDYSHLEIRIADATAGRMRLSGVFIAGQTEAFIDALTAYYPVTVTYDDRYVTVRSKS